jgi:hypothetical protein
VCVKMRQLYILYCTLLGSKKKNMLEAWARAAVAALAPASNNFDIDENNNLAFSNLIKHELTYPNLTYPDLTYPNLTYPDLT